MFMCIFMYFFSARPRPILLFNLIPFNLRKLFMMKMSWTSNFQFFCKWPHCNVCAMRKLSVLKTSILSNSWITIITELLSIKSLQNNCTNNWKLCRSMFFMINIKYHTQSICFLMDYKKKKLMRNDIIL